MRSHPDVLLYGMNFAPELTGIGRYSGELAVGLAQRGAQVEAITTAPHYPGWFVRPPYSAKRYIREVVDGVRVIRAPLVLHKAGTGIWRLIAPLSFALSSAPVAAWRILRGRPRAVLCVEPTLFSSPIALMAAKLVGARTVLHVQDLEVDAAFAVGHLGKAAALARLGHWFERVVMRRFDCVVTISQEMAKRIEMKGVAADRIHVVRNWVDTTRIHPLGRPSSYRAELGIEPDAFVVLYSGQIGPKQALHVVFEAAERLVERRDIRFVIAGEGPLKAAFAERYGPLPNVTLLGLQPEARLNEFLNLADCHILPQHPSIKDLVLPSKLSGMLASGKPVLVIADDDSELAAFLQSSCLRLPTARLGELPEMIATLPARRDAGDDPGAKARLALARSLAIEQAITAFSALLTPNAAGDGLSTASVPETATRTAPGAAPRPHGD